MLHSHFSDQGSGISWQQALHCRGSVELRVVVLVVAVEAQASHPVHFNQAHFVDQGAVLFWHHDWHILSVGDSVGRGFGTGVGSGASDIGDRVGSDEGAGDGVTAEPAHQTPLQEFSH